MSDGVVRDLIQVRYVPKLKRNLISIRMLDQSGCTIKAEKKNTKDYQRLNSDNDK